MMAAFKPGLGRLVAGTDVPIVPCHLRGTYEAMPAMKKFPRWKKISLRIDEPLSFSRVANDRAGWESISDAAESAVRHLADKS
jgi:1-acyl-sn-glycerol-3-phosphate acyltransferase